MQPNNRIYCCIISLLWCLSQGLFCLVARPEINKQGSRSKRNDRGLVHRQYIRCTLFGGPLLILWKGVPLHFSSPGLGMHSQKRVSQVDGQRIVHKKMHICALVNGQYYLKEEYLLILIFINCLWETNFDRWKNHLWQNFEAIQFKFDQKPFPCQKGFHLRYFNFNWLAILCIMEPI